MSLLLTLLLWCAMGCPDAEAERKKARAARPQAQMVIGEIVVIRGAP